MDKSFLEKWGNTISEKGKEVAKKTADTISTTSKDVAQKTKDMTEISMINMKISKEREIATRRYQRMGETFYRKYIGTEIEDEEMEWFCGKIKENLDVIKEHNRQVQVIRGVPICFICGKEISNKAFFCVHCGHRTERDIKEKEVEEKERESDDRTSAYKDAELIEGKICSQCEQHCKYEDFFCANCGNELKERDEYL